jgi:hypothetical protein
MDASLVSKQVGVKHKVKAKLARPSWRQHETKQASSLPKLVSHDLKGVDLQLQ